MQKQNFIYYDGHIFDTLDDFDDFMESQGYSDYENCGMSALYYEKYLFTLCKDGICIDVYF